jgi:hypothetical protein
MIVGKQVKSYAHLAELMNAFDLLGSPFDLSQRW